MLLKALLSWLSAAEKTILKYRCCGIVCFIYHIDHSCPEGWGCVVTSPELWNNSHAELSSLPVGVIMVCLENSGVGFFVREAVQGL